MALVVALGVSLGALGGVALGSWLFAGLKPESFDYIDEKADKNPDVKAPALTDANRAKMRQLLDYTNKWVSFADYERLSIVNRTLRILWPYVSAAAVKEGVALARPEAQKALSGLSWVEDVLVGSHSLMAIAANEAEFSHKRFCLGTAAPRLGGIKTVNTIDDEVFVEAPLIWGSDCVLEVTAVLRLPGGGVRLVLPLRLANLQLVADARFCLSPLVDVPPCVGGASVTLLRPPHVDFDLELVSVSHESEIV